MAEQTGLRNNALPYPIYGQPFGIVYPMLDADGDLVTGATTPDAEVSKNGDTFADCTNESTEIATASGVYYLLLTATEMTADVVAVIAKSATAGMKTTVITLYPRKLVTLRTGTAQSGAAGSITLDSGASAVDDYYNGCVVAGVLDSTNEVRVITDYNGSTKVASVTPNWNTTPDSDDTFTIYLPEGRQVTQADVIALEGIALDTHDAGSFPADVRLWLGTAAATPTVAGVPEVDVTHWIGTAAATPTVAGVPEVDVTHWRGTATPAEHTAGYPIVTIKDGTGTGEIDTASGVVLAKDHTGANLATAAALDAVDNFVDTEIADIQARLPAALVSGRMDSSVGAMAANVVTASAIADNAIDAGALAADTGLKPVRTGTAQAGDGGSITLDAGAGSSNSDYLGLRVVLTGGTGAGQDNIVVSYNGTTKVATIANTWNTSPDGTTTFALVYADSNVEGWQETSAPPAINGGFVCGGMVSNVLTSTALATSAALEIAAAVWAEATRTLTSAANITSTGGTITVSAGAVTVGTNNDKTGYVLSAVGSAALTEDYAADGAAPTLNQMLYQLYSALVEFSISGTTITCKKLDGSTAAMTFTLDSATTPTSRTRAT